MASVVIATCAMCGTAAPVTWLKGSCPFSTGGSRSHLSCHNFVKAQNVRLRGSISTRAASEDDPRSKEEEKKERKEQKEETKTSFFTSITDALDFAQTRSEKDAELLENARQVTKSGDQMSREQYAALRRKVGGTYKDFFKDSVDVVGDYVEDGWVDKTCRVCKKDTSKDARTKDSLGRYAHVACLEKEKSGNFFTKLFGR